MLTLNTWFYCFQVEKTVWDWELMNDIKPIWQRPAKEVEEDEYKAFYKTFSKVGSSLVMLFFVLLTLQILVLCRLNAFLSLPQDSDDPIAHIHFTAEGEVTFRSILFIPNSAPRGLFDEYGSKKNDYIKVCVSSILCFYGIIFTYDHIQVFKLWFCCSCLSEEFSSQMTSMT